MRDFCHFSIRLAGLKSIYPGKWKQSLISASVRDKFWVIHRKIPKISSGAYIFQRPLFFEGLLFGGAYLWREIDWASPIVGRKFTVFALFYFVFECNFQSTSPRGAYLWRGDLTKGFLLYEFGGFYLKGLIHWGAYFRNFMVRVLTKSRNRGKLSLFRFHYSAMVFIFLCVCKHATMLVIRKLLSISFKLQW